MKKTLILGILIATVLFMVCSKNEPPVINSITANPDSVTPGQSTTLSADAEDPDGDVLTYTWATSSGNLSSTSGQSVDWTAPSDTGSYTINLVVEDEQEASDEASKTIRVYPIADTQAPTVSITYPANNDTVQVPVVRITASASDNTGIQRVEFYVDNNEIGEDFDLPYEQDWSISSYQNGSTHSIYAKAYDHADNSTQSDIVTVTVINRGYVWNYNSNSIPIYDFTWSYDPVIISGAPSLAVVDTVHIGVDIIHSWPSDLYIQLRSPDNTVIVIWDHNYPGGWQFYSTTAFAGETVNGTWVLEVYDDVAQDEGSIEWFEVAIDWRF